MYIYNIGYNSYEESEYVQLYHKKRFSKSFEYILYDVVEELIKNFGFKEVKFTSQFNVFGWPDILNEKDWENDRGEQLNRLTKAIKLKVTKKSEIKNNPA